MEADRGSGPTSFTDGLARSLATSLRREQGRGKTKERLRNALRTVTSFSMSFNPDGAVSLGFDVDAAQGRADSGSQRLFDYRLIDRLPEGAAHSALVNPAKIEGVVWEPDAASHVVAQSAGYPYFIQQFGQTTWNDAAASPITRADAERGVKVGFRHLDKGFFRARWDRATPAERDYLAAMAIDGDGPSASGEVAQRLGKKPTSLGPARANLINKGIIYAPEHGQIAFTVPGMSKFIERRGVESG